MKGILHTLLLVFVIGLAIYVGTNLNPSEGFSFNPSILEMTESEDTSSFVTVAAPSLSPLSERRQSFDHFYTEVHKFVTFLEEIDETTTNLANQNPSPLKQFEYFSEVKSSMEEGQHIPFSRLIPSGFSSEHEDYMKQATTSLSRAYQYRKFAADHYLEYLEEDSLAALSEAKEWMLSSNDELVSVVVFLEGVKLDLETEE